jgi:protein-L-isoaspartate(D-aspartate) O-methyltransferase
MDQYEGKNLALIEKLREKGIRNERVLSAFLKVRRHEFVDTGLISRAYEDRALPIGNGQTISQPYVVALMTEALNIGADDKILEIGTGSGFQAAILAQFSRRVYTVERDRSLGEKAQLRIRGMGYENVMFKIGDGSMGWLANAPYDRILVACGGKDVPESLLKQLSDNGRMIIPTGDRKHQELR